MAEITASGLLQGEDGVWRCAWHGNLPDYLVYHDQEWGRPVTGDTRLFEKICLEGFQSGLSWLTILRKRDNFREAFHGFDIERVAAMGEADIERLVKNAGIIRHRGKITSTINNARQAIVLANEKGSLAKYFWSFEPDQVSRPEIVTWEWMRANPVSPVSTAISKDLKKRGWSFVGPTTIYAFMQAMGLVNDHIAGCHCRESVEAERKALKRP
ncbi:MAG: DNA-3-methyladenine glycosylase I [Nitratireductor sp.]|nr:DNA-3-methyladenine glycosylase I [Nitratireductor sp.]